MKGDWLLPAMVAVFAGTIGLSAYSYFTDDRPPHWEEDCVQSVTDVTYMPVFDANNNFSMQPIYSSRCVATAPVCHVGYAYKGNAKQCPAQ